MKLVHIPEVYSACNAFDMLKNVCLFGVVVKLNGKFVQYMHDAFVEIKKPPDAFAAVKINENWFWAVDDGQKIKSDNLP